MLTLPSRTNPHGLYPATLLSFMVPLLTTIISSDTKEETTMSTNDVSTKDEYDNCIKISYLALHKVLLSLFPDDVINVSCDDGESILLEIDESNDPNGEGYCLYDPKEQIAFGISDTWYEAIQFVKAGVQENDFRRRTEDAVDTMNGDLFSEEDILARYDEEDLFSEDAYNAEKQFD